MFTAVWGSGKASILLIEDNADIRELVAGVLERAGFAVHAAVDGAAGMREFFAHRPDLVILDVAMPELDGWAVLERIRELSETPVLMLTARAEELDMVRGLRSGADDYVTKPFRNQELLARVEALLRRARPDDGGPPAVLYDELLEIDFGQRTARARGAELDLTPTEFRLLAAFARHPRQVLGADQLLRLVWSSPDDRSPDQVKLYVSYLRRKLRSEAGVEPISTVRGFGYRYDPS